MYPNLQAKRSRLFSEETITSGNERTIDPCVGWITKGASVAIIMINIIVSK